NFYKDHCKQYSVRGSGKLPIYWMYDSSAGKTKRNSEDGFKSLIYMHRYDEDTTGKVRTDYLHKVQKAYEFKLDNLNYRIENSEDAREIADAEKEVEKLTKQLKECRDYDEKIGHLALQRIPIDLDDGVKVNYDKVQTDENGKKIKILAKKK
ncbi:MAG: BREX-1 system adenine-specific DNA-methyltransferase PglX, partial [Atopostipes sp.]|nr:BREX-1 system adenine-specific DNA-methyltransferase PglX [Atopostipes sp.]